MGSLEMGVLFGHLELAAEPDDERRCWIETMYVFYTRNELFIRTRGHVARGRDFK
jgi:hypothetical protein